MQERTDLRNVAIVAHVDHGKTTLVDALLWQSGAFRVGQDVADRVMDSNDLEREKGITILAKNTAIRYGDITINVVDTPGHADFGGEVERGLAMVDGVILLVDASEGPLPQTRFVLRKAIESHLPVILVVNKVDRSDARVLEVLDEVATLFLDLATDDSHLDYPVVYANARAGRASTTTYDPDELEPTLEPLMRTILEHVPAPSHDENHPLQALVTNLDASPYVGRLALCRIHHGTLRRGQTVAWCHSDGRQELIKVTELLITRALDRVPGESAGPGDIIAIAGLPDVMIGDTIADPDDARPLPPLRVDEPNLAMTIGINTSPLAGREGSKVTARLIRSRLDQEMVGNVSIKVEDAGRPDAWVVLGRGELQLAILVETLRREGFELTVGKPQVVIREIDGVRQEPFERVTVDVPEEHAGSIIEAFGQRRGRLEAMTNHGFGWVRLDYLVPARGLIGFRTEMLTETRGTGQLYHVFEGYEPWAGPIRTRQLGSLVSDRTGQFTGYAAMQLAGRGTFFIAPGEPVYEGMIVGEHIRSEDLDVNAVREKKLTNHRAAFSEELQKMEPPRRLSLEQALEFLRDDECAEVTPSSVRLRKVALTSLERSRLAKRAKELTAS